MHTQVARIDGLTDWYHKHPDADIGDTVLINVDDSGKVYVTLEKTPGVVDSEGDKEATPPSPPLDKQIEIVPSLEKTLEDILEKNLEQLENSLRIYKDDTGIPGRQYSTDLGIIVSKEVDDRLAYALEVLPTITVRKYQIDLKFM